MPYSGARPEKATYGMDVKARLGIERLSPAQRFMLGSLAILAIGMAGIGAWVTSQIKEGVVDRTAATTALYVDLDAKQAAKMRAKWAQWGCGVPLVVLPSPYRSLTGPIVRLVKEVKREHPDAFINIILAQLVTESLWQQLLHRNSGPLFKFAFQRLPGVAVTDVHYRVDIAEPVGTREQPAHASTH